MSAQLHTHNQLLYLTTEGVWGFTPAPSLGQNNGCYNNWLGKALIDVTITLNSQAFIHTLDDTTLRKLAIRSLRR